MAASVLSQVEARASPRSGASTAAPLGSSAAFQLYQHHLGVAADTIRGAVEDGTMARRLALGKEFGGFLASLPSGYPSTLTTAGPAEVLVYLESHYIHAHAGSRLPGQTDKVASPSGVQTTISHLSSLFGSIGRRGPYDPADCTGNPCDSPEVQGYKQGYARRLWRAGYQETSAVPMTKALMVQLVAHVGQFRSGSSTPFHFLSQQRDILLILYSWYSAMRGKEGGQLCLSDLHRSDRSPLFPQGIFQPGTPVPNEIWVFPTHGTKTNKRSRNHQDPAHIARVVGAPDLCFPSLLWAFLELSHLTGHPVSHFIFRPQTPVRGQFKEAPFTSSSFLKMVQGYLGQLGMFNGETGHSFRRGTLQATAAENGPLAAAVQGRIKTPAILGRYLDPSRHLNRRS